jgi:hypothetical protein
MWQLSYFEYAAEPECPQAELEEFMKYSIERELDVPRERVIMLFEARDSLFEWQEGLQSFDHVSGVPGQPGAVSKLVFKMGKRNVEMTETIQRRDLPELFSGIYEADGVWNLVENHFAELPNGRTHWRIDTEFRCKGFMRIMAIAMPGMFKKQTAKYMDMFKEFAEKT